MFKKILHLIFALVIFAFNSCTEADIKPTNPCYSPSDSSITHSKHQIFQGILEKYIKKGLPGLAVLIRDSNGTWFGSAGYADIDKGIKFQPCHISKTASLTKIFMASLALKLVEEGTLQLDEKITKWLPADVTNKIENANEATLRNLLSHTSGIYDVIIDQDFYLAVLSKPDRKWKQEELLEFVYNKPAAFPCETTSGYSNTNTLLVSMIIEKATGRNHADLLKEKILAPLGLTSTYYFWHQALPANGVAQGYFDLYNNQTIINISNFNTGSGCGYTGLYSNIFDLQVFIEALLKHKTLLKQSSLDEMTKFASNIEEDSRRILGLGIYKDFIDKNFASDEFAYGHRGRDLGYSADMFYFPEKDITFVLMMNYGTDANSSLRPVFNDFRDDLAEAAVK